MNVLYLRLQHKPLERLAERLMTARMVYDKRRAPMVRGRMAHLRGLAANLTACNSEDKRPLDKISAKKPLRKRGYNKAQIPLSMFNAGRTRIRTICPIILEYRYA